MTLSTQRILENMDKGRIQKISSRLLQTEMGMVTDWRCDSIGPANRNFVTGGIYRISGTSEMSKGLSHSWSFILKIVNADPNRDDPSHYNFWRREVLAYDSGYLQNLPAGITVPKCLAIDEKDDGSVWLWLEDFRHEPRRWEWNDYAYAAEKLGEFNTAYLLGTPLPEYPWVNRQWMRSWIKECFQYRYVPDETSRELLQSHKRVSEIIRQFRALEAAVFYWVADLEQLPRTFAHQDYYEVNMILNADLQQEGKLGLIDWQFASISGVGEDLGRFLGLAVSRGQIPMEQFDEFREHLLSAYLQGMKRAGWLGDDNLPASVALPLLPCVPYGKYRNC
ncbi:aminoglycoside phosphotransferase family protein [Paenibacillus sp. P25]|nr:aminoglycoside phosphotransferase family protein [Paenibacillus sp. P25]